MGKYLVADEQKLKKNQSKKQKKPPQIIISFSEFTECRIQFDEKCY